MNLEKQIKRHIIGANHRFFALSIPGFESICRRELDRLSDTLGVDQITKGGVAFNGRLTDLLKANLNLRTAGRILMRIGTFKATNFHQLVKKSGALRWSLYLPDGAIPTCKVTAHRSRLYHSQAIAQRLKQVIVDHWLSREIAPGRTEGQSLYVRLENDHVTLSLDSSGDNLYRRGLKRHGARAPLRETIAAAILQYAGYRPGMQVIDPMCGGGTFSLEAALMAKRIAPGLGRTFAFMQWPGFKSRQWEHLKKVAIRKIQPLPRPLIRASDINPQACSKLSQCVHDNGLEDAVQVTEQDFFSLRPKKTVGSSGLVVLNPPYGRRMAPKGDTNDLEIFYRDMMIKLRLDFKNWNVALLLPRGATKSVKAMSLHSLAMVHGGLALTLVTGKIS